jgi:cyclopropane fatty-acyl-phospholipid synthase-like methyltransferase
MDFQATFDGVICIDAVEHICPEDWPGILARFQRALKPDGRLYITVDVAELGDYRVAYERAKAVELPVVFGEVVDELDEVYAQAMALDALDPEAFSGERLDLSVYHYHPSMIQVRVWFEQAGLAIEEEAIEEEATEEEGSGEGYVHLQARKSV